MYDETLLTEADKIILKYLTNKDLLKESTILKENLTTSIVDLCSYIYRRVKNKLANKDDTVEIVAYIIYAIAVLCKNKPEILRPFYGIAGGMVYAYLVWKIVFRKISDTESYHFQGPFSSLFGRFSYIFTSNAVKIILDATQDIIGTAISPTSTSDISSKITKNIFPITTAFVLSFTVSFILMGPYLRAQQEGIEVTTENFTNLLADSIKLYYQLFRKYTLFNKIIVLFSLFRLLLVIYQYLISEKDHRKARKVIVQKIVNNTKNEIARSAIDSATNEISTNTQPQVTTLRANANQLRKIGKTKEIIELLKAPQFLALRDIKPLLVTDKNNIYLLDETTPEIEDRIQKYLTALINAEVKTNEKLNISFLKDISDNVILISGNPDPALKPFITVDIEGSYKFLNGFAGQIDNRSVVVMILTGLTNEFKKNEITVDPAISEYIFLHEAGHHVIGTDYFPYSVTDVLNSLLIATSSVSNKSSELLLRSAVSYLGYVTSVHTELEADAFAAYLIGDEAKVTKALKILRVISRGSLDDPHTTTKIRLLSAIKQLKRGKKEK